MAHARPAPRLFPLLAALLGIALLPEGAPGLIDAPPGHQLCGHVGGGYAYPDREVSLQPSGWSTPRSPEWNQPSLNASPVACGFLR